MHSVRRRAAPAALESVGRLAHGSKPPVDSLIVSVGGCESLELWGFLGASLLRPAHHRQAHYADAIPVALLKREQVRISGEGAKLMRRLETFEGALTSPR